MPIDKEAFSRRLTIAMESQGKTVQDLARMTGTSKAYAAGYTQGRYVPQRIRRRAITEAMHLDAAWLVGHDDRPAMQTATVAQTVADVQHLTQARYGLALVAYSDSVQPGSYFRTKDIRQATGMTASQIQYGLRSHVAAPINAMRVSRGVFLKR